MLWEESRVTDQRVNFTAELWKGEESMTALCRVFGAFAENGLQAARPT